jgi:hypothetical protein
VKRADIWRIILVLALLAPLVVLQVGPGHAPTWLSGQLAGVPLTVCATVAWFISVMLLTWWFARQANANSAP